MHCLCLRDIKLTNFIAFIRVFSFVIIREDTLSKIDKNCRQVLEMNRLTYLYSRARLLICHKLDKQILSFAIQHTQSNAIY